MNYKFNPQKAQTALNLVHDFKEFAIRDNVVDTAIGIIIGSALSNIVSSLVKDILMPPLGLLLGGVHLHTYKIVVQEAIRNDKGKIIQQAVTFNIGEFLQTILDFTIIAACLFCAVKLIKRIQRRYQKPLPLQPTSTPMQEALLMEIRDLLRAQQHNQQVYSTLTRNQQKQEAR